MGVGIMEVLYRPSEEVPPFISMADAMLATYVMEVPNWLSTFKKNVVAWVLTSTTITTKSQLSGTLQIVVYRDKWKFLAWKLAIHAWV